jgi:hypothetical protein
MSVLQVNRSSCGTSTNIKHIWNMDLSCLAAWCSSKYKIKIHVIHKKTQSISTTKDNQLLPFREIFIAYCDHTQQHPVYITVAFQYYSKWHTSTTGYNCPWTIQLYLNLCHNYIQSSFLCPAFHVSRLSGHAVCPNTALQSQPYIDADLHVTVHYDLWQIKPEL